MGLFDNAYKMKFIEKNNFIWLYDGDEALLKLCEKTPAGFGMRAGIAFDAYFAKEIINICYQVKKSGEPFLYARELGFSLWNIVVSYDAPFFSFFATQISDYEAFSESTSTVSCEKTIKDFTVLCVETGDDIIFESIDSGCDFPYREGHSLFSVLGKTQRVRTAKMLKTIIDGGKQVKMLDVYADGECEVMLFLTITPIPHKIRRIMLRIQVLDEEAFYRMHSIYQTRLLKFNDRGSLAYAVISGDFNKDNMIYCNEKFKNLFKDKTSNNFEILKHSGVISESYYNKSGSVGYVELEKGLAYFVCVIFSKLSNQRYICVVTKKRITDSLKNNQILTSRERQMINFIVEGFSNKRIAEALHISEGTVKKTVYNLYRKMEVKSRVELLRRVMFN